MALTDQDLRAFAAGIRPHFIPPLQDIAEEFALVIARGAGARVKELRPETTLDEIIAWFDGGSLDGVEMIMAMEEELAFEISDEDAGRSSFTTFRQLVIQIARARGV